MLGPLGGDKAWDHEDVTDAEEEAQKLADAGDKSADEGGYWYAYGTHQDAEYVFEEPEFIDKAKIEELTRNTYITKLYIAYKK
ncbi:MAG: hypothetical protein SOV74_07930 [Coriobacteriales bacterium]|jgi:hypothetical protein|nr:hypothetical protein [Coriobacteriales bacterium]